MCSVTFETMIWFTYVKYSKLSFNFRLKIYIETVLGIDKLGVSSRSKDLFPLSCFLLLYVLNHASFATTPYSLKYSVISSLDSSSEILTGSLNGD